MSNSADFLDPRNPAHGTAKPAEVEAAIKTIIPGYTVVLLENGDTLVMSVAPQSIRLAVGQKDKNGNRIYNFEVGQSVAVVGKHAGKIDGAKTQADGDGRDGQQPGRPGI